jgi:oligopeptide/dipeptide ABC transporter ATP-binding protein
VTADGVQEVAPVSERRPPAESVQPTPVDAERGTGSDGRDALVSINGLVKYYPIYGGLLRRHIGDVKAVDDVSFDVHRGEVFGLVGESGCGKSTLGRTLLRLQPHTGGTASIAGEDIFSKKGDDLKRLRRRMQIIFQDPVGSLNPRMPISDIIGEGLLAQSDSENGWKKRAVRDERVRDMLEAVGLRREYSRRYPHEFSGGQRQRIGIARALALEPDFIVCDEPVSALDVSIQSQILNLLLDLRRQFNLTYLFIAHNLSVVQYISDRVGVMYLGKMAELAPVDELYANPRHPYTVALLSAVPEADPRRRKRRIVLKGDVPSPAAPPSGCRFHTRCWLREQLSAQGRDTSNCTEEVPAFRPIAGEGHRVACHWAEEINPDRIQRAAAASDVLKPAETIEA